MKKKTLLIVVVLIIVMLVPIPMKLKDGGSTEYKAILYSVTKYHKINHDSTKGYDDGWKVKLFGLTIYDKITTYVSAEHVISIKNDNMTVKANTGSFCYKNGECLRSMYDGIKPNADPRKWEMASKMLYETGKPEMIRSLVGEDITREFVAFCNQEVITLEDVLNDNYTKYDILALNTAEKYATTIRLTQVDEDNLVKVRSFILSELGEELCSLFDLQWCHGDEGRLELIAEAKLTRGKVKVKK